MDRAANKSRWMAWLGPRLPETSLIYDAARYNFVCSNIQQNRTTASLAARFRACKHPCALGVRVPHCVRRDKPYVSGGKSNPCRRRCSPMSVVSTSVFDRSLTRVCLKTLEQPRIYFFSIFFLLRRIVWQAADTGNKRTVFSRASRREFAARHVRKRKAGRNARNKRGVKIVNAARGEEREKERERERSFCWLTLAEQKISSAILPIVSSADNSTHSYGSSERTSAKRPALWSFSSCTPVETKRRNGFKRVLNSRAKIGIRRLREPR